MDNLFNFNSEELAGLYCRLSKDDESDGESSSISTQKAILLDYCKSHGIQSYKIYVDDGYSGLNFQRPAFQEMLSDIEQGTISMVITKDLSRLGRDYIMTGYYLEIYFSMKNIRYIAVCDDYDTEKPNNEIAPFKNILNEMYARDISKKVKAAKHQRAKQGAFIGSQAPYGYIKDPNNKNQLIVDREVAPVLHLIFSLGEMGIGGITIANELKRRKIMTPSALKHFRGDSRFARYPNVKDDTPYNWCHTTVNQILSNRVYTGELRSLKTEIANCKTKKVVRVPEEHQICTPNAHEAIISIEQFEKVQQLRSKHQTIQSRNRYNLFRGKLFCESCGHPLYITRKQLTNRVADLYVCMHHHNHPDECPQTHRVYHDMLYPYVLQQIQTFARSMKRRKVNSPISNYANITELTPEILNAVIARIEVGHVKYKSKPGSVIHIYWKLQ